MKKCASILLAVFLLLIPRIGSGHSGRTDSNGGHTNRKTGEYHYHNGGSSSSGSSSNSSSGSSSKSSGKTPTHKISASNMPSSMQVGESASLDCTVDDMSLSVTWSSSDSSVVSVSANGELTAHAKGSAKIHADYDGTRKSWTVSVKAILATSVDIPQLRKLLSVGESEHLVASILPSNATDKSIVWKSSNAKIATVDDSGQVTAVEPGIATITAAAKDGSKKSDSIELYVIRDVPESNFPIIKESEQANIKTIQTILVALGDLQGKADGKYGKQTSAAVLSFQNRKGIEEGACTFDLYNLMMAELSDLFE